MRNLFLILILWAPASLFAEDSDVYDRVRFSVAVEENVENDLLVASVMVQAEGAEPARLADQVNETMAWALEQARGVDGVVAQTTAYRTSPRYRKQALTGWQVRQSLRLESAHASRLSGLLATLQTRLALESIGYRVSPARQREVETRLISAALKAFSTRAKLVTQELGRHNYRIVDVSVNTGGTPPAPRMMRAMSFDAEQAAVAPPVIEAGSQPVKVTVAGTIELQD